jgi:hypothetical protein
MESLTVEAAGGHGASAARHQIIISRVRSGKQTVVDNHAEGTKWSIIVYSSYEERPDRHGAACLRRLLLAYHRRDNMGHGAMTSSSHWARREYTSC